MASAEEQKPDNEGIFFAAPITSQTGPHQPPISPVVRLQSASGNPIGQALEAGSSKNGQRRMPAATASGSSAGAPVLPSRSEDAISSQELGDRYLAEAIHDEAGNNPSRAINWAEQQGGEHLENVGLPFAEPFINCMCQIPQITGDPPTVSC